MTFDGLKNAMDGLQAAFYNSADVKMGLRSLEREGFSLAQLETMATARGFFRIAKVARQMARNDRDNSKKEPANAS